MIWVRKMHFDTSPALHHLCDPYFLYRIMYRKAPLTLENMSASCCHLASHCSCPSM